MKTVRIRTFLVLVFIFISTLPWIAFVVAHLILTQRLTFETNRTQNLFQPHGAMSMAPMAVWQMLAATFGVLLAAFITAIAMRRWIIKPLEVMRLATEQIATGDLDMDDLPKSRVLEIAEVRDGFDSMVVALQNSFQKQVALEEERNFVINAVAHDLRTPLFALRGYLDGLEKGIANTPDKVAIYVAVCKESSEQLDRLVADLFTFTQMAYIGSDGFDIQAETVNIVDVVMKSVDSLRILAEEKKISILVEVHSDNLLIHGDRHLLARTMNNLLDNAVRHTPKGGNIMVRCMGDNKKVYVTVQDSGSGFSIEDLPHVFEPLYRGEGSRNRATGGAGLGLTISQRIIRRHGGDIVAENNPNGGAIVTFWLPYMTVGQP